MNIKLSIARGGAGLLGVIGLITGAEAIWNGVSGFGVQIADPHLLALLDNEFRFFAASWFLIGFALIVGAILIHRKPDLVQIGLEAVFLGGLARLFAFTEHGYIADVVPAIAIELILPPILLILLKLGQKEHARNIPA